MKRFLNLVPVFVLGLFGLLYTGTMLTAIAAPLIASEPQVKLKPSASPDLPNPAPKPALADETEPVVVKHSKAFYAAVRMHAAKQLRAEGHGILESRKLANKLTDEVIDQSIPDAEAVAGAKFGAIGDGTILQKIIDFFNSPTGKSIIDALVQILLHSIVHVKSAWPLSTWSSSLSVWNA